MADEPRAVATEQVAEEELAVEAGRRAAGSLEPAGRVGDDRADRRAGAPSV